MILSSFALQNINMMHKLHEYTIACENNHEIDNFRIKVTGK